MSKRHRHNQGQGQSQDRQSHETYGRGSYEGYRRGRESDRGYATQSEEEEGNGQRGRYWEQGQSEEGRFSQQNSARGERNFGGEEGHSGRGYGCQGSEHGREFGQQGGFGRESWRGGSGRDYQDFGNWPRNQSWRPEPWQMGQERDYESGRNFEQAGYEPGGIEWERSAGRTGTGRSSSRQDIEGGGRESGRSDYGRSSRLQSQSFGPHSGRGPSGYQRSDERIREDICDRLTEHDLIDATEVQITVRGGEVTLQGTVDDRQMKHMTEDVAESVGGVKEVHNQIRVTRSENGRKKEQGHESDQQKRSTIKT